MITPDKLRVQIAKLDSLMEAFEYSYMSIIEIGEGNTDIRNKGAMAYYAIRDMLQSMMKDMEELCCHMEVCNAVFAVNQIQREARQNSQEEA